LASLSNHGLLMITAEYPPHVVGGAGLSAFELSKALATKMKTFVITPGLPKNFSRAETSRPDNPTVLRINADLFRSDSTDMDHSSKYFATLEQLNAVVLEQSRSILEETNATFDILSLQSFPLGPAAIELQRELDIPMVWHSRLHSSDSQADYARRIREMEISIAMAANRIICTSKFLAERLQKMTAEAIGKTTVIPIGIEIERFTNNPFERNQSDERTSGDKKLMYVGRISPEKGLHVLMEALGLVSLTHRHFHLIVAGSCQTENQAYLSKIKERISHLGLQRKVFFLGTVDPIQLPSLYWTADMVVIPSLNEAFSRVALEAMAAGKPIIGTDAGGIPELVNNGTTGIISRAGDPASLASAIKSSLDNWEHSMDLAAAAKNQIAQYSIKAMTDKTLQTYEDLVRERALTPGLSAG